MERGRGLILAIVLTAVLVLPAGAQVTEEREAPNCEAVPNLLVAIQSDNAGLRESAAYYLGEYRCPDAVLPLMRILKSDPRESTRIVVALALSRIGDARGAYAVKRAAIYDESENVRIKAAWFYNEYYEPGSFVFIPTVITAPVIASE